MGRRLAKTLLEKDVVVHTLQRSASPKLDALLVGGKSVVQFRGDICDLSAVEKALEGCEAVFHVAAKVSAAGKREDFERINIEGTKNVVEACRKKGVRHLVYCSTPSVVHAEGDSLNTDESAPYAERFLGEYARTKAIAERYVLEQNDDTLLTCALRPHLIFGEDDDSLMPRLLSRAKAKRLPIIGDGQNLVDWTYVQNVADAHVLALEALEKGRAAGEAYFITNGEPKNPWVWFNQILSACGVDEITKKVSLKKARTAGKVFDFVWRTFGLKGEPPMTENAAVQVATTHTFSIEKAARDLGYKPKVNMHEATEKTIVWARSVISDL